MLGKIKCTICGEQIKKDGFIGVTGTWPGIFGGLLKPRGQRQTWPFLRDCKLYCKSCFDENFKK